MGVCRYTQRDHTSLYFRIEVMGVCDLHEDFNEGVKNI
jgi:hypothetical protein